MYDDRCEGLLEFRMDILDFFFSEFLSDEIASYFPQKVRFVPRVLYAPAE